MGFKDLIGRLTGQAPTAASGAPLNNQARLETLQQELNEGDDAARLVAIATLEAMAQEDASIHWPVMESLVSHVRERRPVGTPEDEALPADVVEILKVLGRRRYADEERLPLGLFQVDLRGADLTGSDLRNADFSRSFLQDADFVGSRLDGANFQEAYLDGAKMLAVQIAEATFLAADLADTDLAGAVLDGADFTEATLDRANLTDASLRNATFDDASLVETHLEGANLAGARALGPEQLEAAVTDARTVHP